MKRITTIAFVLFFYISNPLFAESDSKTVTLCANNRDGVNSYLVGQTHIITAYGEWAGKKGERKFAPTGSPTSPKHRDRLIAPMYPGGALLMQDCHTMKYYFIGTQNKIIVGTNNFDSAGGGIVLPSDGTSSRKVKFVSNDYPGSYGDNSGCITIKIDTSSSTASSDWPDFYVTGVFIKKFAEDKYQISADIVNGGGTMFKGFPRVFMGFRYPMGSVAKELSPETYNKNEYRIRYSDITYINSVPSKVIINIDTEIREKSKKNNKFEGVPQWIK